ncbi:Hypothetical_protein [Hexamita inflata]|uniref:Hypothetical_protein n=1 Tax=Hexamita inflata TaxID=28002 RepID=A0AA86PFJ5_9EUKA|nr:Hypothetical protein HINF_LOCUS25671 [Hexamita inflata]
MNLINISFTITDDILNMIEKSQQTILLINQNKETIDYLSLLKVVNVNIESFYNIQILILGISIALSITISIVYHITKYFCKIPIKKARIKIKNFDELEM